MIINGDYIFIHIPKCAGNSIQDALGYPRKTRPMKFNNKIIHQGHISLNELEKTHGKQSQFTFAFVRNTWDRVLSLYSHYTQKAPEQYKEWREFGFEKWVLEELEKLHSCSRWGSKPFTTSQYQWIAPGVDFVGRFEYIEEDFQKVCEKLDIEATLGYQTRTKTTHKPYQSVYTNEMIDVVATVFAKDVEYFGHEF